MQVFISKACCVLDRIICLFLHRFLAGTAYLCHYTVHVLHYCHLQAELEENDRRGIEVVNVTIKVLQSLSCLDMTTEFYNI